MRDIVRQGYETGRYAEVYRSRSDLDPFERRFFDEFVRLLPERARVLDLGCGTGVPYDRHLVQRGCDLTGIDVCGKHLAEARARVAGATYIQADFSQSLPGGFDGVMALYALFHVPRAEHARLLAAMVGALAGDGAIMLTLAGRETDETRDDWLGGPMAWSCYAPDVYLGWLAALGFDLVRIEREAAADEDEHHLWLVARRARPAVSDRIEDQ
ncbi:MAG: class I SAM-dependent methyltransferase [Vicinamibacterales bacterium]